MTKQATHFSEIAAVDLGSNSFRLQLARVVDGRLVFHDSLREPVMLGAGLDQDKNLDPAAQKRAILCLRKFAERIRDLPPEAVRAVATNTFRVAKNAPQLLKDAQQALGFPIEIIAGIEEARMIFIGVSHSLSYAEHKRLVIDIGGGSTEFIVGKGYEPISLESLYMGCVSYSLRFFGDGKITEKNFAQAELAAAAEIQVIQSRFTENNWDEAVGSSGTARTLGEVMRINGLSDGNITREGLKALKEMLIKSKEISKIAIEGLSADRATVFPGGLSIMSAAFEVLNIERMVTSSSALREGVLYELLGRLEHHDTREATVRTFMRRYHVDSKQAKRVEVMALQLLAQVERHLSMPLEQAKQYLVWAAKLHEIGISIAHSGYHKHSAYIVEYADMPGFSTMEQKTLGLLMRGQRRSLSKFSLPTMSDDRCLLILILRLAILFNRSRSESTKPSLKLNANLHGYSLEISPEWLEHNPLTKAELINEVDYWSNVNITLTLS